MKKLFPIFILSLILLFASCAGGEAEETSETPDTTEAPEEIYTLAQNGEAQYAVILPEGSNGDMRVAVNSFAEKLGELYGVKFEVKKSKDLAEGKGLIMVGAQDDETYASYYENVPYREYAVKLTDDGNVVIAAWSVESIGTACTKLLLKLKNAAEAGDALGTLTSDIELKGVDTSLLNAEIPQLSPMQMPWIYHIQGANGAYELCFKESSGEDWSNYITLLTENGYSLIQRSENADASFVVLKKDEIEVTVDYWHATEELAVLIDKPEYEAPFAPESITAVTSPKIVEPGLEYEGALKGMCYIIQASDGSFVIIDSGESDSKFLDRIYSIMASLAPEGEKPHIRAWFLTHQHSDHMNGIIDIASSKYASLIECDAVYSNMPYASYQTAYKDSNYADRIARIEKAAKALGADLIIARTGQSYYFADLVVSIIGSVDDMFLTEYSDLDETSILFTVTAGSKKMLFAGDSGQVRIGQSILKRYTAETLKCDICQAVSHGENKDAFQKYYQMADPDYYLWSANADFYGRHTPNKYIQSDTSAQIVYSFNGQYTIELN